MRADRLLSIMLLLQMRGKMTAGDLAQEMEVSPRTIYRDMDALSSAGIPVYADGGPGGGYALLDNYRTSLTGLQNDEMRALFLLTIPGPLADLGESGNLKAAILKLTSALPGTAQAEAVAAQQRLHLDAAGWFQDPEPLTHLKTLQQATWLDRRLQIEYRQRDRSLQPRIIEPYGLVAKAAIWYLVAATDHGLRVYRVSRIEAVDTLDETFSRPPDFDLARFWAEWVTEYESNLPRYPVKLRVSPELVSTLPSIFGEDVRRVLERAQPDEAGWRTIDHTFEILQEAQAYILSLGATVEVIAPEELQSSILSTANEIVAHYAAMTG